MKDNLIIEDINRQSDDFNNSLETILREASCDERVKN